MGEWVREWAGGWQRGTPARWVGLAIALGLILAALGPFGSYLNGGWGERAVYWIGAMLLGLVLYGGVFIGVDRIVPRRSRWRWPVLTLAVLLACLPLAVLTRHGAFWLWPALEHLGPSWPQWFAQTLLVGLLAVAGAMLVRRRMPVAREADPIQQTTRPLGRGVLALQMEDHYVRVHRETGSELILMPLGQAIRGVAADGLRVHRSWWVARQAVSRIEGNARSMRIHLTDGTVAPVSRASITHLRQAGWIGDGAESGPDRRHA